jgi:chromosome segregation and condensation protein ScpB
MSYPNLSALLEAIIYLASEPVAFDAIRKALPDVDPKEIQECIDALIEKYRQPQHGIEIREIAGGLRFSTKPEHHETLKDVPSGSNSRDAIVPCCTRNPGRHRVQAARDCS